MLDTARHTEHWRTCFALLPKVSRTFALSISLLKPPMRQSVCMGYLLCRLVDTFEDAETLPTAEKARFIRDLQAFVAGQADPAPSWALSATHAVAAGANPADLELLEHLDTVLAAMESLPARDRQAVNRCFQEMAKGMIEMQGVLDRPLGQDAPFLRILPSMESLARYCHYVAGIVGTLLTELFYLNSDALAKDRYFDLIERSEAFGQYLQKINILKDIPGDHAKGWCFIPRDALAAEGIVPEDLLKAEPARRVGAIAPVMRDVLEHLAAARQYLDRVPVSEREYRLFLGYSFFFGVKTLVLGLQEPDRSFTADRPLKIGRLEVAAIIAKVNAVIDHPQHLTAYLRDMLAAARAGLDPRWPASVSETLGGLLGSLEPRVAVN
jgi:farnesyl-diphosphate farnesyltransferase